MKLTYAISVIALLTLSCSSARQQPSAADRALRLNQQKQEAAALVATGQWQEAIDYLGPLSKEASADHQLFLMLGDAYAGMGDFNGAEKNYTQSVRLAYTDFEPHLKLATLLMEHRRTGRALTEFELALRFGGESAVTHYNYGLMLHQMERTSEALPHWRLAHEMAPDNGDYAAAIGIALSGVDDEEALEFFRLGEALGADDPGFHNNYGLVLQNLNDVDGATGQFGRAVAADPGTEAYRFNLAALYTRSGQYEDAITVWIGMKEAFGERWSYLVYLGRCYQELENYEAAILVLETTTVELDGNEIKRGDERIDRMPPTLNQAFEILALCERGRGHPETALKRIERAVAISPDDPSHLNNYGVILADNGRLAEAKSQWRRVLEIDNGNRIARENLSVYDP